MDVLHSRMHSVDHVIGTIMIEKMLSYQSRSVCKYTGVKERELRHWCDIGAIMPSIAESVGVPGHRREFSFEDMVEIAILKELVSGGMRLFRARHIILQFRMHQRSAPNSSYMVVTSDSFYWKSDLNYTRFQVSNIMLVISIAEIRIQVKKKVKRGFRK